MLFACVHIPDFPVEAVVRTLDDASRERAVAVYAGTPPQVHVVATNEKARALGAEAGMTKVQAESVPRLLLKPHSPAQEESAHAALLDCAHGFSPRVESTAADTILLDLAGLDQLFGPPQKIARELARRVSAIGLEARVGVAANPDAAMHAARGFPGITIIPPGKEAARLGELSVDVLDPPAEILDTLDRWGVRNFRGLAALPPLAVSERLGQEGLRLQRLARGETSRPLVATAEAFDFSEHMELEEAVELLEPLAFLLSRLLEQLCARLQARALATNELRLTLGLEVHTDVDVHAPAAAISSALHQRTLRLPVPMQDSKIFLKLLQLDLNSNPPMAPVKKITLAVEPVRPRATQNGLFVPASPEPERLELTLARIRKVLGDLSGERVGSPQLVNTHQPDAFRMLHFSPSAQSTAETRRRGEGTHSVQPLRAMRMFRPAVPAQVETSHGMLTHLLWNGQRAAIVAAAGPWRTSGSWWNEPWSRDEWDVAVALTQQKLTTVAVYRIYRDLASGGWFVEGGYD
ncbi:MAG TPA: DNA polymerase Y family protein [Terriglobales bacterium]|nr:DNA polymerase Y family protein [Terriglobales bacterium]